MGKVIRFVKQETVLSVAAVLAAASAFAVPPDAGYAGYIDWRTMAILFSLMTVMAGLRRQGVFDRMGRALLALTGGTLQLVGVLVGLCFFGSMVITNDVALLTFVPFTFVVLDSLGPEMRQKLALPVVCMQTVAANLGSMLTPIGNPQNLYLYGKSGMGMGQFIALMLPYTLAALVLLAAWAAVLCRGGSPVRKGAGGPFLAPRQDAAADKRIVWMYAGLFLLCLLAVVRVLPYGAAFAAVLAAALLADRPTLGRVDYSLLLTFAAFFVFIGNLGRVPAFSAWLARIIAGQEVPVAVLASQVTSNVPAALLLSGFTADTRALIIGTNIGGLGTLIASMASLISYRQIAREEPAAKGRYFRLFTVSNLAFLAALMALWAILG
ncbi:MAG TPA: citrate transporter [Candidatus Faecalibacterium faecipullorum]|uniref:Citrate transporter n=1 Tax=Candidatus Faecalibacterium faecipullorum TaxID=2838578 RepID=A0A9D2MH01_9FIRM|nr:citrate transporter [Candidatus Faecalibacterium faecipullorum]